MVHRGRCLECLRPNEFCFCASIPAIDNQTSVLILQHRRERFHPFNTARIVHKALRNSHLLVDHTSNLAATLRLKPRAGLLYPGPSARLITDLDSDEGPEQLVILDGTWHHAKTLFRDIPALQLLPRYRLAPKTPSRYRIRREPSATALSTVEAAVAALRILEPETGGFDELLNAFDKMVNDQLAHPRAAAGQRRRARQYRTIKNIPLALLGNLENVVVAYGESPMGERGCEKQGPPISWTARRLGTGEMFSCLLTPPRLLTDVFLKHLRLTQEHFAAALPLDEARMRWQQFRRPHDIVTVFHPNTARLLSYLGGDPNSCLVLKSVNLEETPIHLSTEDSFPSKGDPIPVDISRALGRAGERLANTIRYVRQLNALTARQVYEKELSGCTEASPVFDHAS